MDLIRIISNFPVEEVSQISEFGSGLINDSFKVTTKSKEASDYLLQRINHHVFQNVGGMMNNIWEVSSHLQKKIKEQHITDFESIALIRSVRGELFHQNSDGTFWRLTRFKTGLSSYDVVETAEQAYQGARAFGRFLVLLSDFPTAKLINTIPDFHNIEVRLKKLNDLIALDPKGRVVQVESEIKFVLKHAVQMCKIEHLKESGDLPIRVTHNDTKFNNVLLNKQQKAVCVIDLDTVMPGVVHYDFGDGIRTSTCKANEDEPDLTKVFFELDKFAAFTSGYLEHTRDRLSSTEIDLLAQSGMLLPYIMGVRFLTDYIAGDVYYKTEYEGQNLNRARCQLHISNLIDNHMPKLEEIVRRAANPSIVS